MYLNLPIKELPYPPSADLTPEQEDEVIQYCFHDVWATAQVYWRFGSGEQKTKYHTLPARKAILEQEWPNSRIQVRPHCTGCRSRYNLSVQRPQSLRRRLTLFQLFQS